MEGDSAAWWEGSDEGAGGEAAAELLPPEGPAEVPGVAVAALCGAGAQEGPEDWAEDDVAAQAVQEGSWDNERGANDAGASLQGAARAEGPERPRGPRWDQ